jgi:hypothetical protein
MVKRSDITSRKRGRRRHSKRAKRPISDRQLERALRVLSTTKDITAAARTIHVSTESFKQAAKRKAAIRQVKGKWKVARRFPRQMPIFSDGRQLIIPVSSKSAALAGRYMSAVGQFLKSNDPKYLAEFKGRGVKDISGKFHEFEANENELYLLSSAGGEPFEFYRIIL